MNRTDNPSSPASPSRLRPLAHLRALVYLAALAVAAFAFIVSYSHIYDLGRAHAQFGTAARILPLSVDLLIAAASLVLFMQSQQPRPDTWLGRWLPRIVLWSGIGATVGANVAYGLPHGWLAAVISGWPGAAFVGVVEMVTVSVRPGSREAVKETVKTAGHAAVPATVYEAAKTAYAASVADGQPLTEWQLHARFKIPRSDARKIVAPPAAKTPQNGSAPDA